MTTTGRSTKPRRLAVLKPDFGVRGGFEDVVDRLEAVARADGHDVTRYTVKVDALPRRPFGLAVPDDVWARAPEYFRYLASVEAFDRIDTRSYDAVISTQPPSFGHAHPRHLAVFFHHHRIFYDLEDAYVRAGLTDHPALHRQAAAKVRAIDQPRLDQVSWFLAGSESVRARLARFNGIDRVGLFQAGPASGLVGSRGPGAGAADEADGDRDGDDPPVPSGPVLCVGRLEFTKRTELFVHALKHLPDRRGAVVGIGGREAWLRAVDARLSAPGVDLDAVTADELWLTTGTVGANEAAPGAATSNVELLGRVDDARLGRLYREAPCVVAPAFEEDYGLTALEAMCHGTPVVACTDGGGLATLVDDGVDGLVVAPEGRAIAAAIERIASSPALRAELGAGARMKASHLTWRRAEAQFRAGLEQVLS